MYANAHMPPGIHGCRRIFMYANAYNLYELNISCMHPGPPTPCICISQPLCLSLSLPLSLSLSLSLYASFPSIENYTVFITAEATNVASERMCKDTCQTKYASTEVHKATTAAAHSILTFRCTSPPTRAQSHLSHSNIA